MAAQAWHPELDDDDRRRPIRRKQRQSGVVVTLWLLVLLLAALSGGAVAAWYAGVIEVPMLSRPDASGQPAAPAPVAQQASGQPAPTAPQQPQPTVISREAHGDWIHTCVQMPGGGETRCGISQQLTHNETGTSVFVWRIVQDGNGNLVAEWETPTGLIVGRGIVLDAGTEEPIAIPFQACAQTGCIAVATLAPDFLETLSRAESASAVIYPIGGQGVRLMLSVDGLVESLVALGFVPGAQEPMGAAAPASAEEPVAP